jgi:hypothetical protein
MTYQPRWELLSAALTRATSKGDLCNAIADGAVRVRAFCRCRAGDPDVDDSWLVCFTDVEVPPRLSPVDFDWPTSRPMVPWRVMGPELDSPRYLEIEELELAVPGLESVFGRAAPDKRRAYSNLVESAVELYQATPGLSRNAIAAKLGVDRGDRRLTSVLAEARGQLGLQARPAGRPKAAGKSPQKLS